MGFPTSVFSPSLDGYLNWQGQLRIVLPFTVAPAWYRPMKRFDRLEFRCLEMTWGSRQKMSVSELAKTLFSHNESREKMTQNSNLRTPPFWPFLKSDVSGAKCNLGRFTHSRKLMCLVRNANGAYFTHPSKSMYLVRNAKGADFLQAIKWVSVTNV